MGEAGPEAVVRRIFTEYVPMTRYNIKGLSPYVIKMPSLRLYLYRHFNDKIVFQVTSTRVARWLREMGFSIIASGSDGSNSSWIIAIDPRNEEHLRALEIWCQSREALFRIIRALDKVGEEELKALGDVVELARDAYIECSRARSILKCLDEATGLTIIDKGIAFRLANPKVRLRISPCDLLKVIKGG